MFRYGLRIVLFLSIIPIASACENRGETRGQPSLLSPGPDAPAGWNVRELGRIGSVDGPEESSFGSIRGLSLTQREMSTF